MSILSDVKAEGMDAVDRIAPGEPPAEPTKIVRAHLGG